MGPRIVSVLHTLRVLSTLEPVYFLVPYVPYIPYRLYVPSYLTYSRNLPTQWIQQEDYENYLYKFFEVQFVFRKSMPQGWSRIQSLFPLTIQQQSQRIEGILNVLRSSEFIIDYTCVWCTPSYVIGAGRYCIFY